ncbi:hypothetical protein EMCRGX_G010314 [Ephydatia muelleri]
MSGMNIRGAQPSKHLSTRSLPRGMVHSLLTCQDTACCFQPCGKTFTSHLTAMACYTLQRVSYSVPQHPLVNFVLSPKLAEGEAECLFRCHAAHWHVPNVSYTKWLVTTASVYFMTLLLFTASKRLSFDSSGLGIECSELCFSHWTRITALL